MQFSIPLKLLIISLVFLLVLPRPEIVAENENEGQLDAEFSLKYIVIDPGHGGRDPGCLSQSGVKEKDITLSVSRK